MRLPPDASLYILRKRLGSAWAFRPNGKVRQAPIDIAKCWGGGSSRVARG
jgi:hypothetical protein